MTDLVEAIRELNAINLPVDNELGDQIVAAWLNLHLSWAQDAYNNAAHADDKADAASDLICMSRVYKYVTGKDWEPDKLDVEFKLTVSERDD